MSDFDFKKMWDDQYEFMTLLTDRGRFPGFPVDLTTKAGQQDVVHVFHHAMDELYEAKSELKNAKRHRVTEIQGVDMDNFVEEMVDVQKLLMEVLIMTNVDIKKFYDMYFEKSRVNNARVKDDY